MKIAIIDIGSNSLRMQISKAENGIFDVVEEYKEMLRLGDDVFRLGYISQKSLEKLAAVLNEIKLICSAKSVDTIRTIATASFREAENSKEVVMFIKEKTGFDIEIIDGKTEAYLGFLGVSANFDISGSKVLITDIGGGSAEFVVAQNGRLIFSTSTPYGCNKLFVEYFKHDPPTQEEILAFKNDMRKNLSKLPLDDTIEHIIGLGGTANNIAFIKDSRGSLKVRYADRKFLKNFLHDIMHKTAKERADIKNLEPKRADIILSTTLLVDAILNITQKNGFYTLNGGLRSGLAIDTINKAGVVLDFQKSKSSLRVSRIMEIGKKFNFEKRHAVKVKELALSIFDKTEDLHNMKSAERNILEAAALLHDVGNYISYSKHHKHSYYLVKNSEFIGYSLEDVEIMANVARYHRKSPPKDTHEHFKGLDKDEKKRVGMLAAILRIADALDRTHEGAIKDVDIKLTDGRAIFELKHSTEILPEKKAFERKKDLFEEVFNLKAVIK